MAERRKRARGQYGEGSIFQRKDGRWCGTISLGYANGKRQRKTIYGNTQREVLEELRKLKVELYQNGQLFEPSKLTLSEYLEEWYQQIAPTRRQTSLRIYDTAIRLHINPALGHVKLAKLTSLHIQRLYTSKTRDGYAPNTVRTMHTVLTLALNQAVKWGMIRSNPAEGVELPKRQAEEMQYLSPEQVQQFVAALLRSTNKHRALLATAVMTGMRLGELTALSWDDVDLQGRIITVQRNLTWDRHGREFTIGKPKTKYGVRTVPFPASLVPFLRERRREQNEDRLRAGEQWEDHGNLVFTTETGRPLHQQHARKALASVLREAGLPQIRFHDLRHTYATLLLTQGTHPKVASGLLGHSSVKITLDLYSHLVPGLDTAAADQLDNLIHKAKASTPQR